MMKPNFFIIGAPKGGTTALAAYLSDHPRVFFSAPKEVFFWAADFPRSHEVNGIRDIDAYLRLFQNAREGHHLAVGEGSTTYFQSEVAVRRIREFNPDARFILMLRNPVDVAHGMHGELVRHFYETETDFETAWALQSERAAGRRIPNPNYMVHQLQYREVAAFGPQLQRFFEVVPESRRLVIIFDDFAKDTRSTWIQTLQFLGLPDDGRTDFPRMNAARKYRLPLVGRLYQTPPAFLAGPVRVVRNWYNRQQGGIKSVIQRFVQKPAPREALSPEFREHLKTVFQDDVRQVSALLGRDLSRWTAPDPPR